MENSALDFLPQRKFGFEYNFNLIETRLNLIEKRLIMSSHNNEMLVTLSSHYLAALENIEINGKAGYDFRLDDYQLRPCW